MKGKHQINVFRVFRSDTDFTYKYDIIHTLFIVIKLRWHSKGYYGIFMVFML